MATRLPSATNSDDHHHDGQGQQGQHQVDEALEPPVAGPVQLTDVEQERHPLELGHRQHAQPLLVEQRQGAHPGAPLVGLGHLGHHRRRGLGLTVEHHHRDVLATEAVEQRLVVGRGRLGLGHTDHPHQTGRALGRSSHLLAHHRGAGRVAHHQHPIAAGGRQPGVGGQTGTQQVPGHQQDGRPEDHEPGQERIAHGQLHQRDAERTHQGRGHRGGQSLAGVARQLGQTRARRRRRPAAGCRPGPRRSDWSRGSCREGWRCRPHGACSAPAPPRRCRGRGSGGRRAAPVNPLRAGAPGTAPCSCRASWPPAPGCPRPPPCRLRRPPRGPGR